MTDRIMDPHSPKPEPSEGGIDDAEFAKLDVEAEFAKLDVKVAEKQEEKAEFNNKITEVRVQFRGETFGDNPAIELRVGDTVVAFMMAKDAALLAASIERLGVDGNTVVMWGYLPPETPAV